MSKMRKDGGRMNSKENALDGSTYIQICDPDKLSVSVFSGAPERRCCPIEVLADTETLLLQPRATFVIFRQFLKIRKISSPPVRCLVGMVVLDGRDLRSYS
jgi:hypothetical protein